MKTRHRMKRRIWAVVLVLLAAGVRAQDPAAAQPAQGEEVHINAVVEAIVPLTDFSGAITPVDIDPKFALTLRIQTVNPTVEELVSGAVVTFAIHSPSLLFGAEPTKGAAYDLFLHREMESGQVRFYWMATHAGCAQDDEPVGYPLQGWVGYTNTGVSVTNMTVQALSSPGKRLVATAKTDTQGKFSFPTLGRGKFYLKGSKKLGEDSVTASAVVTVGDATSHIACLVAD